MEGSVLRRGNGQLSSGLVVYGVNFAGSGDDAVCRFVRCGRRSSGFAQGRGSPPALGFEGFTPAIDIGPEAVVMVCTLNMCGRRGTLHFDEAVAGEAVAELFLNT